MLIHTKSRRTLKEDAEVGTVVDKTVVLGEYSVAPGSDATTATLNPGSSLLYSAEGTPKQIIGVYPASISYYVVNNATSQSISSSSSSILRNHALKITLPATQTYAGSDISKIAPMMANTQAGGNLEFKNITALLAITVPSSEMSSVQKITVSSGKKLNGEVSLNDDFSLNYGTGTATDAEKTLTLNCQTEGANTTISEGESKTFYVSIPPQTYDYLQILVTDGTTTKTMRTKASSIEVARNTIYPITFAKNYDPNLLAGVFTVSAGADGIAGTADDKKVKFTKGNLYWTGSAFALETNQYDFPVATDYTSDGTGSGTWLGTHIGLFFWNSYDEYITTTNGYKPYDSSHGHLESWSTSDVFWCGKDHKLEVAGTQGLYVLSVEEWYYLTGMFTYESYDEYPVRTQTNRFANAMVNGKAGLLIFPDGYNGTTPVTGITGIAEVNNDNTAYPSESIPTATWSAMEAAGVVFLPAAGYRGDPDGQTITPGYCQYWSSTPHSEKPYAYGLYGTDAGAFTCPGKIQRKFGSSIRLVKTVE